MILQKKLFIAFPDIRRGLFAERCNFGLQIFDLVIGFGEQLVEILQLLRLPLIFCLQGLVQNRIELRNKYLLAITLRDREIV